jgi:hypothetical protein
MRMGCSETGQAAEGAAKAAEQRDARMILAAYEKQLSKRYQWVAHFSGG